MNAHGHYPQQSGDSDGDDPADDAQRKNQGRCIGYSYATCVLTPPRKAQSSLAVRCVSAVRVATVCSMRGRDPGGCCERLPHPRRCQDVALGHVSGPVGAMLRVDRVLRVAVALKESPDWAGPGPVPRTSGCPPGARHRPRRRCPKRCRPLALRRAGRGIGRLTRPLAATAPATARRPRRWIRGRRWCSSRC